VAQEFNILRMQRAADAWLTHSVKLLCCSEDRWAQRQLGELGPRENDKVIRALKSMRALALTFPFLGAYKEACETALRKATIYTPCDFEVRVELRKLQRLMHAATKQLTQLRAAQPRKELVRCV
jgi:hypothetical protein